MKTKLQALRIQPASEEDWQSIRAIYIEGIKTGLATFETEESVANDPEVWFATKIDRSILKALEGDAIVGWAALSPVSDRCVYGGVAEISVYVTAAKSGNGIGYKLLRSLIHFAEDHNIWTLQAGIFPDNHSSMHIHKKAGFRLVGIREKLGKRDGEWKDVALLERRSSTIL
ncbi:MAG: N-acetyltransferase [Cyclobacteriaceae bacterium]|nr:N-acetyltransferase [Cyclobacteriaceae bacterium HetDA_MAG_MS6]